MARKVPFSSCSCFLYIDNIAPNATPSRSSLNLFDEILIEEGTAKKASYDEVCINMKTNSGVLWGGLFQISLCKK